MDEKGIRNAAFDVYTGVSFVISHFIPIEYPELEPTWSGLRSSLSLWQTRAINKQAHPKGRRLATEDHTTSRLTLVGWTTATPAY